MHSDKARRRLAQLVLRLHPQSSLRSSRQIRHRLRLDRFKVRSGRGQDCGRHRPICLQSGAVFGSGLERGRRAEQLLLGRARREEASRFRRALHGTCETLQVIKCFSSSCKVRMIKLTIEFNFYLDYVH